MKINSVKKVLKISILMTVILALPIMYTIATEKAISYTLSEDKKSAMIHLDVNKVIGSNDLVEVKNQNGNQLSGYDITITENGTYSYIVTYKEKVIKETEVMNEKTVVENTAEEITTTSDTQEVIEPPEVPNEEMIIKNEKLEIIVTGIESDKKSNNVNSEAQMVEEKESSQPLQASLESEQNVTSTTTETDAKYFGFDEITGTITSFPKTNVPIDVVVPSMINGVEVKRIGPSAFSYNVIIKSVELPDGITDIENSAFKGCDNIERLVLPSNLVNIKDDAFNGCWYLREIKFPDSVKSIGKAAFAFCKHIEVVELPKYLSTLGSQAFYWCDILKEVSIPNTIENIGEKTFFRCRKLEKVKLSSKVVSIGKYAFAECESLSSIELPNVLENIEEAAFYDCISLSSVKFSNVLKNIGKYAFQDCIKLSSINNFPTSIQSVGEAAFDSCALANVIFEDPKKNPSVASDAFIDQRAAIRMYHTSNGDYIDFNEYTPFATKITLTGNDFTMLDNGITKSNIKNPLNIIYSYPVLGEDTSAKFYANSVVHVFYAYKAQFICEENIVEEKYVLEDEKIVFPSIPEKEGYTGFWDKTDKIIQRDEVFTVIYKIKPYLEGSNKIEIDQSSSFDPNHIFIFNDADGNIIDDVVFTGDVNTNKPGEYILEYEATDQWGGKTKGECFVTVKAKEENKGEIVFPGEDGIPGTDDDIIVKPGAEDNNGNVIIPDGGTIIYPNGDKEEFPNGGIIIPGEDGKPGTKDDIIVKPVTIDSNGNIIIPDGGTIIYPNGDKEEFPNGGIIITGEDRKTGTDDDIIVKPGTIDDNGNITIPDGGIIIYPDGSEEDFPNGGLILPGEDETLGTEDDVIVKSGTIDNQGNIVIDAGGEIIDSDGRIEKLPNGGMLYAGLDGIFGTKDDHLIKNKNQERVDNSNENQLFENVITSDNTYLLLWSLTGLISLANIMILMKRKRN